MSKNNQLEVLDCVGCTKKVVIHPIQNIIAYTNENSAILWHISQDKKIIFHKNQHQATLLFLIYFKQIQEILFIGDNYEYLLTINANFFSQVIISEWETVKRIQIIELTNSAQGEPYQNIIAKYNYQANYLIICQISKNGGYTIFLFYFNNKKLILEYQQKLEYQQALIDFNFFHSNSFIIFATVEQNCIKIFKFSQSDLVLQQRLVIKENIIAQTAVSLKFNFLFFVTDTGRVFVINEHGCFIQNFKYNDFFTCVACNDSHLFLGTKQGVIKICPITSLGYINEIYFTHTQLANFQTNQIVQVLGNSLLNNFEKMTIQSVFAQSLIIVLMINYYQALAKLFAIFQITKLFQRLISRKINLFKYNLDILLEQTKLNEMLKYLTNFLVAQMMGVVVHEIS